MGNAESNDQPSHGDVVGHDDIKQDMIQIIEKHDVKEAKVKIEELLTKWKTIHLNLCLLGERGAGKSSFINNMMGAKVAKTGVKDTTREAQVFHFPQNEKLSFWDMPGYNPKIHNTIHDYLKIVDIKRFDVVLFLHKSMFRPSDAEIVKDLQKYYKPLILLRTHFDIDSQDTSDNDYESVKDDILTEITSYDLRVIKASERDSDAQAYRCYFISNRQHKYDYEILMNDILLELEESEKRDAFVFCLQNQNRTIIEMKRERLKRSIEGVAVLAAYSGMSPVSGIDAAINIFLINETVKSWAKILGVEGFMEDNPDMDCVKEYQKYLKQQTLVDVVKSSLLISMSKHLSGKGAEMFVATSLFGCIVSSPTNLLLAKRTLTQALDTIIVIAEKKMREEERRYILGIEGDF